MEQHEGTRELIHDSTDEPLVLAWLASRAYPDAFADYPLEDTIREYYKTWYGYDVTDDELAQMLVY